MWAGDPCGPFNGICADGLACQCISGSGCADARRCEPAVDLDAGERVTLVVSGRYGGQDQTLRAIHLGDR